jgi:hypothetical protein
MCINAVEGADAASFRATVQLTILKMGNEIMSEQIEWLLHLTRMGADLTRIGFPTDYVDKGKIRPFNPATDMQSLVATAASMGGVSLLILDSIVATVPPSKNCHNNAETRSGMQSVIDFAEATNCATIDERHIRRGHDRAG